MPGCAPPSAASLDPSHDLVPDDLRELETDPSIDCSRCDAICCRLTVVLLPGDDIPLRMTEVTDAGLQIMARDEDGWCVAIDSARMCCSIYETRPQICRKFAMGGPYCQAVREDHSKTYGRDVALKLV